MDTPDKPMTKQPWPGKVIRWRDGERYYAKNDFVTLTYVVTDDPGERFMRDGIGIAGIGVEDRARGRALAVVPVADSILAGNAGFGVSIRRHGK